MMPWRRPAKTSGASRGRFTTTARRGGAVPLAIHRKPNIYYSPGGDTSGF
jgi:hypothetical protein